METVSQLAHRLGISWHEAAQQIQPGEPPEPKPIRKRGYTKTDVTKYLTEIGEQSLTAFAKDRGLNLETLKSAIQQHAPLWWANHTKTDNLTVCPNCQRKYYAKPNQKYCSLKCGQQHRVNLDYFGGDRSTTIGLIEETCQLCGRSQIAGLSSHHVLGKENDPENKYLVALCRGCHQIVTLTAQRNWNEVEWQALISLSMLRKSGVCGIVKVTKGDQ
jgi:hypothetical protein